MVVPGGVTSHMRDVTARQCRAALLVVTPDRLSDSLAPTATSCSLDNLSVAWHLFLLVMGCTGTAPQFLLYLRDIKGARQMPLSQGSGSDASEGGCQTCENPVRLESERS